MSNETKVEWPQGYRINPRQPTPPAELVEAFRGFPVAAVGDCMGRSIGAVGLRAYHADIRTVLCGPALTVRVRPGDNLMLHKAMLMAEPGDVIVVDGGGDLTQALMGGLMRTTAITRKIAGFVLDGAVRDTVEWAEGGVAMFAKGHTHRGPSKDGPGEVNVPIACAGLVVNPGDLILGDADGVIAIPADELERLRPQVEAQLAKEEKVRALNAKEGGDPVRFDALLRAKGVPV